MSLSKRQICIRALSHLGIASYVYDLEADQITSAADELDSLVAELPVRIGWPGAVGIDDDTGIADWCHSALILGLAVRLAPSYGRGISDDLRGMARQALDRMLLRLNTPPVERQLPPTTPLGAGAKRWRYGYGFPFAPTPADPLLAGQDGRIDFDGND